MTIDQGMVLSFQVNITLDPGAEVVGISYHVVLYLAGLNAAQAPYALGGVYTVRPAVLCPVIIGRRK